LAGGDQAEGDILVACAISAEQIDGDQYQTNAPRSAALSEEIQRRQNLYFTFTPLPDTARMHGLGRIGRDNRFLEPFRARLFDHRQFFRRDVNGSIQPIDNGAQYPLE
jgi:hypothetical protein